MGIEAEGLAAFVGAVVVVADIVPAAGSKQEAE